MGSCKHWIQTQNEDKQNTQHKHRKPTGQPGMGSCKHWIQCLQLPIPGCPVGFLCLCNVFCFSCPFLVVLSVFYVCVVYFVFLRSVYCIQCLQLPIPGCPVGFLCLCNVFCLSSFCVQNEEKQNT
jgi:hypothetical protein